MKSSLLHFIFPAVKAHIAAYDERARSQDYTLENGISYGFPSITLSTHDQYRSLVSISFYTVTADGTTRQLDLLKAFMAAVQLSTVTQLNVEKLNCVGSPADWLQLFSRMPCVRTIAFESAKPRYFDGALLKKVAYILPQPVESATADPDAPVPPPALMQTTPEIYIFPFLTEISFARTNFFRHKLEGSTS